MIRAAMRMALFAGVFLAACQPADEGHGPGPDGHGDGHGPAADHPEPPRGPDPEALLTVRAQPVAGRTGPGEQPFEVALRTPDAPAPIARRIGTRTFVLGARTRSPELGQYPCTSCHIAPARLAPDRVGDAHRNLELRHPREAGSGCSTCHAPDVQLLQLQNGETVTMDHAYRLCAQCHFEQVASWSGGAHGKRLDGWRGRRVVMPCAECHDPHQPALEPRIPFRPPVLSRSRR